jgi:hypothetical protein
LDELSRLEAVVRLDSVGSVGDDGLRVSQHALLGRAHQLGAQVEAVVAGEPARCLGDPACVVRNAEEFARDDSIVTLCKERAGRLREDCDRGIDNEWELPAHLLVSSMTNPTRAPSSSKTGAPKSPGDSSDREKNKRVNR